MGKIINRRIAWSRNSVFKNTVDTLPKPESKLRGQVFLLLGLTGEQDAFYICLKTESETYAWAELPANFI